jgi:SAM-dependent methyltransferase
MIGKIETINPDDIEFQKMAAETTARYFKYLGFSYNEEEAWRIFLKDEATKIDNIDRIEKTIFPIKGKKILDVGCGKGGIMTACAMRGADVSGFDVDLEEIEFARSWAESLNLSDKISIEMGDGENIPFADNTFDLIICSYVLEHVKNPEKVIREISRVLKPGGFCCASIPNPIFPREGHYKIFWIPFLPKALGRRYLELKGFNPDFFVKNVYYLSVSRAVRLFKSAGLKTANYTEENTRIKLNEPETIKDPKQQRIALFFKKIKITKLVTKLIVLFDVYSHLTIIAQKPRQISADAIYDQIDPEAYENRYKTVPREIYLRKHWQPIISEFINKYCKNKDILDLGCGYGRYIGIIGKCAKNVTGLDNSVRWLDYARQHHPGIEFILGDARAISLKKEFDAIVSIGLLEYVDRGKVLKEIYRLLKPDGICIISVPNKYSFSRVPVILYRRLLNKNGPQEPSFGQMASLFKKNGFKIVECKMDDGLIWLPGFLDRLIGLKTYSALEGMFKIFGKNHFSTNMLFIITKK